MRLVYELQILIGEFSWNGLKLHCVYAQIIQNLMYQLFFHMMQEFDLSHLDLFRMLALACTSYRIYCWMPTKILFKSNIV